MLKNTGWTNLYCKKNHEELQTWLIWLQLRFTVFTLNIGETYEQAHDKTYNKTCVTSKDSDQPVQPPSMATNLVYPS